MSKLAKSLEFDITIVIPAYCEEKRIGATLKELARFLKNDFADEKVEVIVVAADAPDRTHALVEEHKKLFPYLTLLRSGAKVGKGRDVRHGMLRARGRAVIFMDADLATPLHHLQAFYNHHKNGHDVVIATRNLHKHHPNFIRRLISNGGNLLFCLTSGLWVEDSQCGFKMFSWEAAQQCFSKLTILGWGFDMEILAIAKAKGMSIQTHRIDDWQSLPGSTFTGGLVKNAFVTLRELFYIALNRARGVYND